MAAPTQIRQAVVLAGGRGSRLGSVTEDIPKPLLPVGGRPFVEWVIANLVRHGVDEVLLTVGYKAEEFERWLRGQSLQPAVSIFVEDTPLDTGGALTMVGDQLHDAFYVVNGDTLFDAPIRELGEALVDDDADAALALRRIGDTARYGAVEVRDGRITRFTEKDGGGEGLINGGVYAMRRRILEGHTAPLSIERELLPERIERGRLLGLPSEGFFIDIGTPETFLEAQTSVPKWWASLAGA